jgi:hypothetical protein
MLKIKKVLGSIPLSGKWIFFRFVHFSEFVKLFFYLGQQYSLSPRIWASKAKRARQDKTGKSHSKVDIGW